MPSPEKISLTSATTTGSICTAICFQVEPALEHALCSREHPIQQLVEEAIIIAARNVWLHRLRYLDGRVKFILRRADRSDKLHAWTEYHNQQEIENNYDVWSMTPLLSWTTLERHWPQQGACIRTAELFLHNQRLAYSVATFDRPNPDDHHRAGIRPLLRASPIHIAALYTALPHRFADALSHTDSASHLRLLGRYPMRNVSLLTPPPSKL
jgi:hypothetical protein